MERIVRGELHKLSIGTVLADKYEIISILGEGGFGITYRGRTNDGKDVAIKEYFPSSFAWIDSISEARMNGSSVNSKPGEADNRDNMYSKGLRRFLGEGRLLKEFQYLDGVVKVYDCFEANDTAYIVMEYVEGITLKEYVTKQGTLSYKELVSLLSPVMHALIQIHRRGIIHRDISPDNILIGLDNRARLIDFGAVGIIAEDKVEELSWSRAYGTGVNASGKTVILKTGYAPPEQYIESGNLGAWTDVYGLAATIYMGLTGIAPTDAVERLSGGSAVSDDELRRVLFDKTDITGWQADAILSGLALSVDERYSDMEEFYNGLTIAPSIEHDVTRQGHSLLDRKTARQLNIRWGGNRVSKWMLILMGAGLVIVIVLSVAAGMMLSEQRKQIVNVNTSDHEVEAEQGDIEQNTSVAITTEHSETEATTSTITTESKKNNRVGTERITTEHADTEQNTTDSSSPTNTEKVIEKRTTTEAIKIHEEDDSMEHLEIED